MPHQLKPLKLVRAKPPVRLIIEVNKGMVSAVYSSDRSIKVSIMDTDNLMNDGDHGRDELDGLRAEAKTLHQIV